MKRGIVSRICRSVAMCVALAAASSVSLVYADGPRVTFELTDEPGPSVPISVGHFASLQLE